MRFYIINTFNTSINILHNSFIPVGAGLVALARVANKSGMLPIPIRSRLNTLLPQYANSHFAMAFSLSSLWLGYNSRNRSYGTLPHMGYLPRIDRYIPSPILLEPRTDEPNSIALIFL